MSRSVLIAIAVISLGCALIFVLFVVVKSNNHHEVHSKLVDKKPAGNSSNMKSIIMMTDFDNSEEFISTSEEVIQTTIKPVDNLENFKLHRNYKLFNNDKCGIVAGESKILRGHQTKLMANPWIVALINNDTKTNSTFVNCAGTLISDNLVLTAAHCVHPKYRRPIAIRLGDYNVTSDPDCTTDDYNETTCADKIQEITDFKILPHEDYSHRFEGFEDIALIKLNTKANLDQDNINTICLPFAYEQIPLLRLYTVGWGRIYNNDTTSDVLLGAFVPYVEDKEECQKYFHTTITKKHICAGGEGLSDTCKGDSGGSLSLLQFYEQRVRTIQFGIVSYGPLGGCGNAPAVYTRIYSYLRWIMDNADF